MVAPFRMCCGKIWGGFCLNTENVFSQRFHLKPNRKSIDSSKNGTRDFKNSPLLKISACFYVTTRANFERFQYFLTLKQIFWKTKTFFKKLEYCFLVVSTKIENASLPYKTAISEANIKTNGMASIKQTYHKERSSATNNFVLFFKFYFSLRTYYKGCNKDLNAHIPTFCKRQSFI